MRSKILHLLLGLTVLSFIVIRPINAQESDPIYSGNYIVSMRWSDDSQFLTFRDGTKSFTLRGDETHWQLYDAHSDTWTSQSMHPFFPNLSRDYLLHFEFGYAEGAVDLRYFISPDGQFLIYQAEALLRLDDTHDFPELAIANIEYLVHMRTGISMIGGIGSGTDTFNVIWGNNSKSFVYSGARSGASNIYTYVYDYAEDLYDVEFLIVNNFELDGVEYFVKDVTSISEAEKLVAIVRTQPPEYKKHLVVYDPFNVDDSLVFDLGNVIGAHFNYAAENEILFINEDGLSTLNYKTGEIKVLDSSVNAIWADRALFSPDATRVAIVDNLPDDTGIEQIDLYVHEIPD